MKRANEHEIFLGNSRGSFADDNSISSLKLATMLALRQQIGRRVRYFYERFSFLRSPGKWPKLHGAALTIRAATPRNEHRKNDKTICRAL